MALDAEKILDRLMLYIALWQKLEKEYYQIPGWRHFKQMANIRKREKLTKDFVRQTREWGLIVDEVKKQVTVT